MATILDKTLTILGVRDDLGIALDNNLQKFEKLDRAGTGFGSRISSVFNTAGRVITPFLTVAAAGAGAVATGLAVAGRKAVEFNGHFRELSNLNLDKTDSQIEGLRKEVLDTALATGRLPAEMNKAFFDIQSGTGKFGKDVRLAATDTSRFSRAFKVDFNTALEGGIKGMRNFNLEADQLQDFYGSMVKTVQVGIVTFEQLARVQTDYAGSAAAAGQNVDSANKLFAIFTTRAKSAEEAATLTKGAFQDLLKPATLQAFSKLGIQVFDKQTGKVRQLDQIVGQLNEKFRGLRGNDKAMAKVLAQFTGNEGLVALIGEAAKNGDNMLQVFKDFDNTDFNLDKALRNAKLDAGELAEIARNKVEVIMTRIGEKALPLWVSLLDRVDKEILPAIIDKLPEIEAFAGRFAGALGKTIDQVGSAINTIGSGISSLREKLAVYNPIGGEIEARRGRLKDYGLPYADRRALDRTSVYRLNESLPGIADAEGNVRPERIDAIIADLKKRDNKGTRAVIDRLSRIRYEAELNNLAAAPSQSPAAPDPADQVANTGKLDAASRALLARLGGGQDGFSGDGSTTRKSSSLGGVSGGERVRNINVTIQKLVGIENMITNNLQEGSARVKEAVRQVLIEAVRDAEVGLSQIAS